MLPYIAAAIAGAVFVQRKRPAVAHAKKTILGRSGVTYEADDFSGAGIVVLKAPDGTIATFAARTPPAVGFEFVSGHGNPKVIDLIKSDMR